MSKHQPEAESAVADFAGVVARVEAGFDPAQLERVSHGCLIVRDRGAELAVLEAGARPPIGFDVALIAGAGEELAQALSRLDGERLRLLPLPIDPAVVDAALHAALDNARLRHRAQMADELLDVGVALVAERDPSRVLELILSKARQLSGADAGSIYVVEGPSGAALEDKNLRFRFAENASIEADFAEFNLPITEGSVVGACVLYGTPINLADLYSNDESSRSGRGRIFTHDRSFDERFGYQTRSMLTVPMRPPDGEVLGVIQLINARRDVHDIRALREPEDFEQRVVPFDDDARRLCEALAAQGAVALENARLYAEIEALFEGFVRASVKAIEQRDPTTSGHSERVADLTVGLAEVVDRAHAGVLSGVHFSRAELRELEYAALLHDFGKVGVREQVLVKAKKLYPNQYERIMGRFAHMRTAVRLQALERMLHSEDSEVVAINREELAEEINRKLAEVDALQELVELANEPSVLGEDRSASLRILAEESFIDGTGARIKLLDAADFESLRIPRGSLTAEDRRQIQDHVENTWIFLRQIPWGRELSQVPEIALKHHRYLNGSGYPERVCFGAETPRTLSDEPIPVQAQIMTIADIFDALTAADRPYKKAVPLDRALAILEMEVRAGKLDGELFSAFVEGRVYERIELARDKP
ncbi:GAF domain-containing protein [Pseudenhygromyxa sp. WMMC2535]|uniref:HD family phosphohydrolase n=1 Tax=Pseudenhygromyxa sp. WMMC2535 TaxID=2712867 RepID=UPI0015554EB3|nr:HD family phosphohydrolase [Pseudenhygromyxa sp. WMMC2535]NVB41822.1 GAF domain-containing protein [Pseudenhygromyxa sp. WMMC2535]